MSSPSDTSRRPAPLPLHAARFGLRYMLVRERAALPIKAYFLLHDGCNLRCRFCNYHEGIYQRPDQEPLDTAGVKRVIDRLGAAGVRTIQLSGGEPTLREDILEVVRHAVSRIPFVNLTTNGTRVDLDFLEGLVRARPNLLWLSLDATGSVHDEIRGVPGTYERVLRGMRRVNELKRRLGSDLPKLYVSVVVQRGNIDEITRLGELAIEQRVSELEFTVQHEFIPTANLAHREALDRTARLFGRDDFYTRQHVQEEATGAVPSEHLSRQLVRVEDMCRDRGTRVWIDPRLVSGLRPRTASRCLLLWARIFIGPHGDVRPCEFLDGMDMGNLRRRSVEEVWNGARFRHVRRLFASGIPICRICPMQRTCVVDLFDAPTMLELASISRSWHLPS